MKIRKSKEYFDGELSCTFSRNRSSSMFFSPTSPKEITFQKMYLKGNWSMVVYITVPPLLNNRYDFGLL